MTMTKPLIVALVAFAVSVVFMYLQIWGVVSWRVGQSVVTAGFLVIGGCLLWNLRNRRGSG